jgi:hypothetical protein
MAIKSRKLRWVGRVWTGEIHTGFWWEYLRKRDPMESLGVDGRIILKWIFKTWNGEAWT